jgi:hypothetical protein
MTGIALALAWLVTTAPAAAEAQRTAAEPPLPAWMTGCWTSAEGDQWSEECWMAPRGGMMLGTARSGTAGRVTEWETMRIEATGGKGDGSPIGMAFRAAPRGMNWTTFAWSPESGAGVTFINIANEYPQRIRYWREGDLLRAEVSQVDGSRPKRWAFSQAAPATPPAPPAPKQVSPRRARPAP